MSIFDIFSMVPSEFRDNEMPLLFIYSIYEGENLKFILLIKIDPTTYLNELKYGIESINSKKIQLTDKQSEN